MGSGGVFCVKFAGERRSDHSVLVQRLDFRSAQPDDTPRLRGGERRG